MKICGLKDAEYKMYRIFTSRKIPEYIRIFCVLTIIGLSLGVAFFIYEKVHPNQQEKNSKTGFVQIIQNSGIDADLTYDGVSWGDYDSDGYMDLFSPSEHGYKLYHNNHNETFTDVTEKAGLTQIPYHAIAAAFGDYNNDGCPDLYVSDAGPTGEEISPETHDSLYHNNCNGTFTDVSEKAGINIKHHGRGISWGDYNNDGFLDLYIATWGILKFDKSETAWKLKGWAYEPNVLYHNNGNGTFTNITTKAHVEGLASCKKYKTFQNKPKAQMINDGHLEKINPGLKTNWQPVWFDYNNDGLLDLYVTNEVTIGALYKNNGNGTFTDVTEKAGLCQLHSTHGIAVGDYDNDGYFDLYLSGSHRNLLWHNNKDGTFTEVSEDVGAANFGFLGWGVGSFDYDNDGFLDIYSVNGSSPNTSVKHFYTDRSDRLYKNNGQGQFFNVTEKEGIFGNDAKTAGAFADFNNDGFIDAFIVADINLNQPPVTKRLYKNIPNDNHWLTVKLVGTKSNREGIGARIIAESSGKKQVRQVISGGSLLSQNSIWPTLGLGNSSSIDKLTVLWPSGIIQTLDKIKADQILTVTETK